MCAKAHAPGGGDIGDGLKVLQRSGCRLSGGSLRVPPGRALAHAYQPPGCRSAEREEEGNCFRADECVYGARLQIPVGFEVAQKEGLGIGVALEGDAGEVANCAVRAVTPNQEAAAQLFPAAVGMAQNACDGVVVHPE